MRYVRRVQEEYLGDEQERLELHLNDLLINEGHTSLGELYRYYCSLRRDDLPFESEFVPSRHIGSSILSMSASVDTGAVSPENFIMRDHPEMPSGPFGTELTGLRLVEFPSALHADSLIDEYSACRRRRQPMYHEIDQTIGGVSRAYRRLMLPLLDPAGDVKRIAYGFRFLREPHVVPLFR